MWVRDEHGTVIHLNTGRSRGRKKHCKFCTRNYHGGRLCDFPVGEGRTCDAEMCESCCVTLGRQDSDMGHGLKRINDSVDVCPIHRAAIFRDGKLVMP